MWNQYYHLKLTEQDIQMGRHRGLIGGMWEEMGALQLKFMKEQGLEPSHELLDVGCGSLRGGIYFIHFLNKGKYNGLDINPSLIQAAKAELKKANLTGKKPMLIVNDSFHFDLFNKKFDFAIAQSVFTHLPINIIHNCLVNIEYVLNPGGKLFATFFETNDPSNVKPVRQKDGLITYHNRDPYHHHISSFKDIVKDTSLQLEYIGDWGHPRNQKMLCFYKKENTTE